MTIEGVKEESPSEIAVSGVPSSVIAQLLTDAVAVALGACPEERGSDGYSVRETYVEFMKFRLRAHHALDASCHANEDADRAVLRTLLSRAYGHAQGYAKGFNEGYDQGLADAKTSDDDASGSHGGES